MTSNTGTSNALPGYLPPFNPSPQQQEYLELLQDTADLTANLSFLEKGLAAAQQANKRMRQRLAGSSLLRQFDLSGLVPCNDRPEDFLNLPSTSPSRENVEKEPVFGNQVSLFGPAELSVVKPADLGGLNRQEDSGQVFGPSRGMLWLRLYILSLLTASVLPTLLIYAKRLDVLP
jgi:hypothetical protein